MANTLLLTGTIDPNVFNSSIKDKPINVYLTDARERLNQYNTAIERYIKESSFDSIVFAENSGAKFDSQRFKLLADQYGKKFEYILRVLSEEQISKMQQRGKSYGEADLIDFAFRNSQLLSQTSQVYKATGRAFLTNSKRVISDVPNQFIAKNKIGWVNTEFFKVDKNDYFTYLAAGIDLMDDYKSKNIERVWYKLIKESGGLQVKAFKAFPRLHGVIGSAINKNYDKSKTQYFVCDLLCAIGYFNIRY